MALKLFFSLCTQFIFLFVLVTPSASVMSKPRKLYTGYKLIRVNHVASEYEDVLIQTLEHRDTVQLWRLPKVNNSMEMLVGQSRIDDVMEFLRDIEVDFQVIHSDISVLLNEERDKYLAPTGTHLSWKAYHDYQDITNYFMSKVTNSGDKVLLHGEVIGKSELGHDIYLYSASKSSGGKQHKQFKPAIWIDAGLSGRDWLAVSASTYILNRLISGDFANLLEEYDVYVLPLINIDGYHYTRTTDRFWAKNRAVRANGRGCEGVHLDRNFALMYRGELLEIYSRGTGLAHNPCSDYYGGNPAHIEPEVTAVSRAIWARREQLALYISLQSYSQVWLLPREASKDHDFDTLTKLAEIGNSALTKKSGVEYSISSWNDSQAEPPGKGIDWAKQIAGIRFSYGLKLRDDGTARGYLVPATEVQSVGDEILAAVSAMAFAKSND